MIDRETALQAVRTLITYIGDDPQREGLLDTPDRVLKAWLRDWGKGYSTLVPEELIRIFEAPNGAEPTLDRSGLWIGGHKRRFSQMVVVRDIDIFSHCEHHMTPFFGRVHIGYIPGNVGLIGLSKLARVADYFARRLQVQERLGEEIADFLHQHLSDDIGVTMSCTHLCMVSRGVHQAHTKTITSALRGAFLNDASTKAEFFSACA